jgi:hypothetical protein
MAFSGPSTAPPRESRTPPPERPLAGGDSGGMNVRIVALLAALVPLAAVYAT